MNQKRKRPNYTKEFKQDAIKLVTEQGYSCPEVGRRLDIPTSNVSRWVRLHRQEQQDLSEGGITRRELEAEVRRLKKQAASGVKTERTDVDQLIHEAEQLGDVKLVVKEIPGATPQVFRDLIDQLRRKAAPVAVLLAARDEEEGKVLLVAGLSRDLVERGGDAVKWVRQVAKLVQGGGGGRPDLAQAGGKNAEKLPEALAAARDVLEKLLS